MSEWKDPMKVFGAMMLVAILLGTALGIYEGVTGNKAPLMHTHIEPPKGDS